ncbi:MAG TPA: BsuBI/PstI family type II restriction endonuclease [Brevundimonas sp.]|nr:BsuBI/PstI family type II restriction endonuclease [Brevundimonas sp.]
MTLPSLPPWQEISARLPVIFPAGTPNRDRSIWEISAKTIYVMLYVGAIEGRNYWLRPDQVSRMTESQAVQISDAERFAWARASMKPGKGEIPGRWYAVNTRESIRDDTIRYSLIQNGAVIERAGLATSSPAGRYALQADFAALFDPAMDEATFFAKAEAWREKHLNAGALARIALNRRGAVDAGDRVLVTFPNGETRALTPSLSSDIVKAVVEVFALKFLEKPGVISISESSNKVVARDDELAKAIGLEIAMDKHLPDVVLVDLGPKHPLLVFVEVVATDGPINDLRKDALREVASKAGFSGNHVAFVTAYLDRSVQPFKRTVDSLAWGTYAWFASEPDCLAVFASAHGPIRGEIR